MNFSGFRAPQRGQTQRILVAAALGSVVLVSCSAPVDELPGAMERSAVTVTADWEVEMDVLGQPAVADGVALVYTKGAELQARAVSLADGSELWSQPIHPGVGAPGIALAPRLTKTDSGANVAVFLQQGEIPEFNAGQTWWTSPVAVDLKTGEELWRGEPRLVTSRPSACADGTDVCFTSRDPFTWESVEHKLDLDTKAFRSGAQHSLPGSFRGIGESGLYSVVENGRESIARVDGSKTLWTVGIEDLFGPGASTDYGWNFRYSEQLDLYVGQVGWVESEEQGEGLRAGEPTILNLADSKVAGIRASTGEVLWMENGTDIFCTYRMGLSATTLEDGEGLPVRCDFEGTVDRQSQTYEATAKLVGFDPLTGEAVWESEPQEITSLDDLVVDVSSLGDFVAAKSADGILIIDTATGDSKAASPKDQFFCSETAYYEAPPGSPYAKQLETVEGSNGGSIYFPCGASGDEVEEVTESVLRDVDSVDGNTVAVTLRGRVAAYTLP